MFINPTDANNYLFKNFASNKQSNFQSNKPTTPPITIGPKREPINVLAIVGSAIGTLIPLILLTKSQNRTNKEKLVNILTLQYKLKEILYVGSGALAGGFIGGIIGDKFTKTKEKAKEGLFNLLNITIPTSLTAGLIKLCEKSEKFNNKFYKVTATIAGLAIGMSLAAKISNKLIAAKDNKSERKLKFKDCYVHFDDIITAAIFMKIPMLDKFHPEALLPFLYGLCGYETGSKK